MNDEQLDALIGLIADLGREVHWMLDDCEESGPVGDSTFTVEGAAVDKVSEILDRIEALPFEATPDAILLPGAMLREALQQSIAARTDAAVAAALEGTMEARKGFPILGQRGAYVDWQLVADHGGQANTNHGQTVARLAERGGLSWCELFAVLHNQRFQRMDANDAMIACRALEARYLAALIGGAALPRL